MTIKLMGHIEPAHDAVVTMIQRALPGSVVMLNLLPTNCRSFGVRVPDSQ